MTDGPHGVDSNLPIQPSSSPGIGAPKAFEHNSASSASSGFGKLKEMLGDDGYKKFLTIVANMVSAKMHKEAAKMKEAQEKLKKALTGEDSD